MANPGRAASSLTVVALLVIFAAYACRGGDSEPHTPSERTQASPSVTATAATQPEPPSRDLFDLARRFRGLPADASRLARATPYDYGVGDLEEFSLIDLEVPERITISASVRLITEHAYFFVQEGVLVSEADLERVGRDFESEVYPTVTAAFGKEWTPGVDSDPRMTILHADLSGAAGYFSGGDEFPAAMVPRSNEREMLYVESDALNSPGRPYNALVAHELQHMIHWQADSEEDSWINEGLSQIAAEAVLGGSDWLDLFLATPDLQLTHWPSIEDSAAHYAAAELFMRYTLDRAGGRENAMELVGKQGDGINGIEDYLADYDLDFRGVFADWVVANYLDDDDGRYAHAAIDARTSTTTDIRRSRSGEGTVHQFAADYLQIRPPEGGGVFTFDGSQRVSIGIPADEGPHSTGSLLGGQAGQAFWWSNHGDGIDSRLTREFDLTGLTSATLRFSTWFDIEEGWDYAYVAVSADDGDSWQALPGRHTSDYDPVEAAYGPGYTGSSDGWVPEEVDLNGFAGQKLLVRFEYVTDDASNLTGFAVDGIEIPELGFSDPGEDGGAWEAEGFRRIAGPLVQEFIVQTIEEGTPSAVTQVALDAGNRAEIELNGPATIVVAAVTDGTTEVAPYTWSLTSR